MHRSDSDQRGFTLIELLITVGTVAVLASLTAGFSLAMKPYELAAATQRFDAIVASAKAVAAADGDGATIFVTAPAGSGFAAALYAHRPGGRLAPVPTPVQPLISQATVTEGEVLHDPAFAIVIHADGAVGGRANFGPASQAAGNEVPCPGNAFRFVFAVNGHTAVRTLPCRIDLANAGTAGTETPPASPPSATPNPVVCATGPCPATPAPADPLPTCPPDATFQVPFACRYPLNVTPAGLRFINPSDTNPRVTDANGSWIGTNDAGGVFHISERYFVGTYSLIDGGGCAGTISFNPLIPPPDTGSGSNVAAQPLNHGQCALLVSDNAAPQESRSVGIVVEDYLRVSSTTATFSAPNGAPSACVYADGTIHDPCTITVRKWGYDAPRQIQLSSSTCQGIANVSPSTLTPNGDIGASFSIVRGTANGTCALSVMDDEGEMISVNVSAPALTPPQPPPPPAVPCSLDSFGYCSVDNNNTVSHPTAFASAATCGGTVYYVPYDYQYSVYNINGLFKQYTARVNLGSRSVVCNNGTLWDRPTNYTTFSPSDPSSDTGDPNLPTSDPVPY